MKNFDATSKKLSLSYPIGDRLLRSPSLVEVGLSVGYESWPPIDWPHPFVIGWSEDRLGLPSDPLHFGLTWPMGIPTVLQSGPCKGTVEESIMVSHGRLLLNSLTDSMQRYSPMCLSPHSLIKQRKYQLTIIETILLARKLQNSTKQWNPKPVSHIT